MTSQQHTASFSREAAFDLLRGVNAYTRSTLMQGLAEVAARHPEAEIDVAFNHKQVACKTWARDAVYDTLGGDIGSILVLGGWYGVFAGILFDDPRFTIGKIVSVDIDETVGPVARTLNGAWADRFDAVTEDMYALPYSDHRADLVVNTSCEHIADLRAWLDLLPKGARVLLQSNDYFSEPTHISCVASLEAFEAQAGLSTVFYAGSLPQKKYTRFMLIGEV
ncbi:class I SAM-dependent methyltransferase [Rhizobium sp. G21]|uniref:class I SAM-dependent methyltransferase n=1 Tax=Rhizobium sp. G21 TaxID=2758439 RepID=UPI001603EB7D|nr:class I SAM-dependent methyltransferase [Rhizobium sp. G21]MBB1251164.1 class I SAM-dependent methyltransferase [Rhizobium sp. G21]